jgi:hypothetical protein
MRVAEVVVRATSRSKLAPSISSAKPGYPQRGYLRDDQPAFEARIVGPFEHSNELFEIEEELPRVRGWTLTG